MFKTLRSAEEKNLNHSGRSHIGETMQVEGDLRSAGSLDVAGLVNGSIFVSDMTVTETGSVRGSIESANVEIKGHVDGKITANSIIVGKSAVIKGDIFFKNTLKTLIPMVFNLRKRIFFRLRRANIMRICSFEKHPECDGEAAI